jgi:uncharacterized cofD-like protein
MTTADQPHPLSVVVLGGGNGASTVLRGLRRLKQRDDSIEICAIVATSDDGGSSGRLRKQRGGLPPGDLRNCLLALADDDRLSLATLFGHRFGGSGDLAGHAVGNVLLAALAEREGCYLRAIDAAASLLGACGAVLPVSLDEIHLIGRTDDGTHLIGESRVGRATGALSRVWLDPAGVHPAPGVLEAIRDADLIVLGPGSLYTSLLAVLMVDGVVETIRAGHAPCVLVANLMTQPDETLGLDLAGHLAAIDDHVGDSLVDEVLVNSAVPAESRLQPYRLQGAELLTATGLERRSERLTVANLINAEGKIRHDPVKLAGNLLTRFRRDESLREFPVSHPGAELRPGADA